MRRFFLTCFILLSAYNARAEIINIDNARLESLLSSGIPLIDVRTVPEWEESGIVPGSHLLTFFDERGRADPDKWLKKVEAIAKPGDPVIVMCRSGNRTKAVSEFLSKQAGYAKVYNVKDGIRAWISEGRPVAPASPVLAACRKANAC